MLGHGKLKLILALAPRAQGQPGKLKSSPLAKPKGKISVYPARSAGEDFGLPARSAGDDFSFPARSVGRDFNVVMYPPRAGWI